MGRDLFRRKALVLFPLALALLAEPLAAVGEPGRETAVGSSLELSFAAGSSAAGPFGAGFSTEGRQLHGSGPSRALDDGPTASRQIFEARHGRSAEPEFGLELPDHPAVSRWIEHYRERWNVELVDALERARLFRRFVAEQLQTHGLPQELLFLPVLESHYRVQAVSRSGAAGLWQIMVNTSGPLGLRRNLWLDERRDFWLATAAALRKLEENHRRFGSWPMALAAYNCGTGYLSRAVRTGGTSDFWELRAKGLLSRETAEYVPKFYALVSICSYPERYGLVAGADAEAVSAGPRTAQAANAAHAKGTAGSPGTSSDGRAASADAAPTWVRIELDRSVELALLARLCGIAEELLMTANAELNLGVTPPPSQGYALKVPADSEERVRALLADPQAELLRYQLHQVRTGDTFYGLSRHYGVAVELIQSANPTVDPRSLRIGAILKIPVVGRVLRDPPAVASTAHLAFTGRYTVVGGDTLWAISRRYGTTPEILAAANGRGLDALLQPGETLKVPGDEDSREGSGE